MIRQYVRLSSGHAAHFLWRNQRDLPREYMGGTLPKRYIAHLIDLSHAQTNHTIMGTSAIALFSRDDSRAGRNTDGLTDVSRVTASINLVGKLSSTLAIEERQAA